MGRQDKLDQIAGILNRHDVNFGTSRDDGSMRVLYGSTAVFIDVRDMGPDSLMLHLHAPAVVDVDFSKGDSFPEALIGANALNRDSYFLKYVVYDDSVLAEMDLLGDDLQGSELMNALGTLANAVDELDDDFAERLGGSTFDARYGESSRRVTET